MKPSLIERFEALEHQNYLMYLQLNAVTKLLIDSGMMIREQVGKYMDEMHDEISRNIEELEQEEDGKDHVYN